MPEHTNSSQTAEAGRVGESQSAGVARYRILERHSPDGSRTGYGLAFESEGEVLVWYPPMRGPIPLAVSSLDGVADEHVPLKHGEFTWSPIHTCSAPIEPMSILKSSRPASGRSDEPDAPPQSVGPGPTAAAAPSTAPANAASVLHPAEQREEPSMSDRPRRGALRYAEDVFAEREAKYHREKRCIAEYTAWWLRTNWADGAIAIDGGTTNEEVVKAICRDARQRPPTVGTIISNNLEALQIIGLYIEEGRPPAAEATGGTLRGSRRTLLGRGAVKSLEEAQFDAALVGANGFNPPMLATATTTEHQVKQQMIRRGSHIMFPIDAYKWGLKTGSQLVSLDELAQSGKRAYMVTSYPIREREEAQDAYNRRVNRFKRNADALILHWINSDRLEGIRLLLSTVQLPSETNVVPHQDLKPHVVEGRELRGVDFFQEQFAVSKFLKEVATDTSVDADLAVSIAFELHDPQAVAH